MVTFNFTYDPGVTVQQAVGFEMAGRIWSRHLSDSVTLNIHVGVSGSLPSNVIGGALPGMLANADYGSVIGNGLRQDQKSDDDRLAFQQAFNSGGQVTVGYVVPLIQGHQGFWSSTTTMNVTRANAKAIGAIAGGDTALDGAIAMGTLGGSAFHWNYDYTRSNTAPAGSLDFLSVAIHEIRHVLGFISGVDLAGWNFTQVNDYSIPWNVQQHLQERTQYITPLDRLRHSYTHSLDTNDLSYGTSSGNKFFALGRWNTRLADFAMGKNSSGAGDGYQASHWKEQSTPLGIMDPALAPRERGSISNLDLQALDVIGWDLRNGLNASNLSNSTLASIRDQAVQALSQRLGRSTTWINANPSASPANLARDRSTDVETMIRSSQVYEWGTVGSGTTSTSGRKWVEIFNEMASFQEVYVNYSTVSNVMPPASPSKARHQRGRTDETGGGDRPEAAGRGQPEEAIATGNPSDLLLGIDQTDQLVGRLAASASSLGSISSAVIPEPPTGNSPIAGSGWVPVETRMDVSPLATGTAQTTGARSQQFSPGLFPTDLGMLLGLEGNPLAQRVLGTGLMQ